MKGEPLNPTFMNLHEPYEPTALNVRYSVHRQSWRKRLGVEPSPLAITRAATGFEDREGHRALFASMRHCRIGAGSCGSGIARGGGATAPRRLRPAVSP